MMITICIHYDHVLQSAFTKLSVHTMAIIWMSIIKLYNDHNQYTLWSCFTMCLYKIICTQIWVSVINLYDDHNLYTLWSCFTMCLYKIICTHNDPNLHVYCKSVWWSQSVYIMIKVCIHYDHVLQSACIKLSVHTMSLICMSIINLYDDHNLYALWSKSVYIMIMFYNLLVTV